MGPRSAFLAIATTLTAASAASDHVADDISPAGTIISQLRQDGWQTTVTTIRRGGLELTIPEDGELSAIWIDSRRMDSQISVRDLETISAMVRAVVEWNDQKALAGAWRAERSLQGK